MGELRLASSHSRRPRRTEPPGPSFQQPVAGQLPDQPVRRGQGQPGPVSELRELQGGDALREGGNEPQDPVHH